MVSWAALAAITVFLLWVDLHFFARGREPSFREGVVWSIGWLVVSMLAGVALLLLDTHGLDDFVTYTTVYFVERSLSLDNLFVFVLLFAVLIANFLTQEGESNWFEGVQLLSLYAVLGIVFYLA